MVCMAMKLAQSSTPKVIHIGFGTLNPPMLEVKYSSESENGYMPIYCILSALIAASVVSESTISRYIPKIRMNSEKQVSMNESFAGGVPDAQQEQHENSYEHHNVDAAENSVHISPPIFPRTSSAPLRSGAALPEL